MLGRIDPPNKTLAKHLDSVNSLPTSPTVNILNHITLLKNWSLPFIPLTIFLQMLNTQGWSIQRKVSYLNSQRNFNM